MEWSPDLLITQMNPLFLLGGLLLAGVIGWFCAYRYRGTNDFAKSCRLLIPFLLVLLIIGMFCGLPIIVLVGIMICGFIFTALFSNYFFYH